jgi:2-oxoglutarate ferredoxin oxidoreductase subunit beta
MSDNLKIDTENTWCPGCGNFAIEAAIKDTIKKIGKEKVAITAGIGCHGKIIDYIDVNSFYGLHGRPVALAEGIKFANPELKVIAFSGDGDSFNEGISHLIHAAKRNSDITVVLHQNRNFALTVKQYTASSPKGFISNSSPSGNPETPLNALELVNSAGATFIARSFTGKINHLKEVLEEAVNHKGFSFVEVLQPCITWYNTMPDYQKNTYEMETIPENTLEKIKEWDYGSDKERIPLGIFKKIEKPIFEEEKKSKSKEVNVKEILKIKA